MVLAEPASSLRMLDVLTRGTPPRDDGGGYGEEGYGW